LEREARDSEIRRAAGLPTLSEPDYARRFDEAWSGLTAEERAAYLAARREMNDEFPRDPPADVQNFIDHIDYAVGLIGIDHVGIASDFNNGEGVTGWFDAGETLNVTIELVRRGYTEDEIAQLWGLNLLRVMDEAQRIGRELQGE
jgi:microsomal dipeptidase-like Zn-dependent dipeptidase